MIPGALQRFLASLGTLGPRDDRYPVEELRLLDPLSLRVAVDALVERMEDHDDARAARTLAAIDARHTAPAVVSLAERLIPAADLSEQISMAGKEASGTGNMKFAMNGALTIGTLDGANIEIRDAVGEDHFFLFGHTAAGVQALKQDYVPERFIAESPLLQRVLALIERGFFCHDDPGRYRDLVAELRHIDTWLVCADFDSYIAAQDRVDAAWQDAWAHVACAAWIEEAGFADERRLSVALCGGAAVAADELPMDPPPPRLEMPPPQPVVRPPPPPADASIVSYKTFAFSWFLFSIALKPPSLNNLANTKPEMYHV